MWRIAERRAAMSVRSHSMKSGAWIALAGRVSTSFAALNTSLSMKATREPCAAKCSTMDAPIPEAPPVIRTTLSSRLGYRAYLPLFNMRWLPRPYLGLVLQATFHAKFNEARKQLVQLDHRMHEPRHHHFPFVFQISFQRGFCNPLRADAANRFRTDHFVIFAFDRIDTELGAHVTRANGKYVNPRASQFDTCGFSDGIHGEFRAAINGVKRQRDMSGNARDVDQGSPALLLHDGDNCLHPF